MTREQKLEAALRWILQNADQGCGLNVTDGNITCEVRWCGCCAVSEAIPADILETLKLVNNEMIAENAIIDTLSVPQ